MLSIVPPVNAATYTYDLLGRLTSVTYSFGLKIVYEYDAGGNLKSVTPVDTTPLKVVGTDPADGTADVPVDKSIYVSFNKNIRPGDNIGNITLKAGDTPVSYTYSITGSVLSIDPVTDLSYSTAYAVYIPAGAVKDAAGNALAEDYIFTLTTEAAPVTVIPAAVNCDPDVLNPKSKGRWVTVYIQLPAGYDVSNIDIWYGEAERPGAGGSRPQVRLREEPGGERPGRRRPAGVDGEVRPKIIKRPAAALPLTAGRTQGVFCC